MTTKLNPYLGFRDNAREAMDFYHSVFGGDLTTTTFGSMHATDDPAENEKIMHAELNTPNGMTIMASDTPNSMEFAPGGAISVSISGADEAELRGYWDTLSDGGTVGMPLERAPWDDIFGMCTDRFGIEWMISITR
jgi:PhnB protein